MSLHLFLSGVKKIRAGIVFPLILLSLASAAPAITSAVSYDMRYDLRSSGVPFAGGVIVLRNNFTDTGQLTIRLTSLTFASDFWPNGTRQIGSGLQFNLTAGTHREVDTPLLIPESALVGSHLVTNTVSWQYSNSSGWFNTSPIAASITIIVSETIGSLFPSLATALFIGLGTVAAVILSVVAVVIRRRRKQKSEPSSQPALPVTARGMPPGARASLARKTL